MASIEQRDEGTIFIPDYSGRQLTDAEIAQGRHRNWVGGHWDDGHGKSQLDFLVANGLRPQHKVIDIGCGSFRAGMHFVDYLASGNYYGVDANRSVMQAGYEKELSDAQRGRLPITNLRANERFDADFGVKFDYALAQSVFTHVSLNHVRLCLYRAARVMAPGGKFYATFFEERAAQELDFMRESKRAKQRFSERNVYWYYRADLAWAASFSPWKVRYIGDWGHPAGQRMMEFTRTTAPLARPDGPKSSVQQFVTRGRRWAARHIAP